MSEESKKFTGFCFRGRTYVFKRMLIEFKVAGAKLTRDLQKVLGVRLLRRAEDYLDDILIHSRDEEEHLKLIERSWKTIKPKKGSWMQRSVRFLGHTLDEHKICMEEETKEAITSFRTPTSEKTVQSFLGLCNWDRKCIENLSDDTRPLEKLLKKARSFTWGPEKEEAFDRIKDKFRRATGLYLIGKGGSFGIKTDASKVGLGARLCQHDPGEEDRRTLAYASRSLKAREEKYTITALEGLAVVWALKKLFIWLSG